MRTRFSRKGLSLAVQGQVCGGGQFFFTFSFLSNLTSYHFLRFVNQVQTSKEVWCHFQEVWQLDVPSFHLNFLTKGLLAGATSSSNCSEARAARCLFSIVPTKLPILSWAILKFTLNSISLSLFVLIFASVLDWREEVAGNGMMITLCAYSSLSILSLSYAMSLSEIQIF